MSSLIKAANTICDSMIDPQAPIPARINTPEFTTSSVMAQQLAREMVHFPSTGKRNVPLTVPNLTDEATQTSSTARCSGLRLLQLGSNFAGVAGAPIGTANLAVRIYIIAHAPSIRDAYLHIFVSLTFYLISSNIAYYSLFMV
jgi:hypothetical protein